MNELDILGRRIPLTQWEKSQHKGINVGEWFSYNFYDGVFHGVKLLFMEPKHGNPSPRVCSITANRLSDIFERPVVFVLNPGPSYERQRLIDKDVFFVMGKKYANLPMLVANERIRKTKRAQKLTPVAQYVLLYHLQMESLEGLSARDIAEKVPYSYESVTLGLTCLSDLGLCEKKKIRSKSNIIHFTAIGRDLWDKAQEYLIDPVDKRVFCDALESKLNYTVCGINALSHYSHLNPDDIKMIMMDKKHFLALREGRQLYNQNEFDGNVMIEIWKYPPVSIFGNKNEWVDKLSLVLSLREYPDARVEGEVERVINGWLSGYD